MTHQMTRKEWNEYVGCDPVVDAPPNPVWLLPEVLIGDDPHARPSAFADMLEDGAYEDRFVSGGEVGR